jgi:hypothetical protein
VRFEHALDLHRGWLELVLLLRSVHRCPFTRSSVNR